MMTPESVGVAQVDREAAASFIPLYAGWNGSTFAAKMRTGKMDEHDLVQAFARHRLTASTEAERAMREAAAKVADDAAAFCRMHGEAVGNTDKGNSVGRMIDALAKDIRALALPSDTPAAAGRGS